MKKKKWMEKFQSLRIELIDSLTWAGNTRWYMCGLWQSIAHLGHAYKFRIKESILWSFECSHTSFHTVNWKHDNEVVKIEAWWKIFVGSDNYDGESLLRLWSFSFYFGGLLITTKKMMLLFHKCIVYRFCSPYIYSFITPLAFVSILELWGYFMHTFIPTAHILSNKMNSLFIRSGDTLLIWYRTHREIDTENVSI